MWSNFNINRTSLKYNVSIGFWTFSLNDRKIVARYSLEYFDGTQLWRFTDRIRCFLLSSQMLAIRTAQPNAKQLTAIFVVFANQEA